MHDEQIAEQVNEVYKSSKLKKFSATAVTFGLFAVPVVITGVAGYYGLKTQKMQYDLAKLNLETARMAAAQQ
jgi:hypothetical protein